MHVDEARCDDSIGGIDRGVTWRRLEVFADFRYAAIHDADVAQRVDALRRIDQPAPAN